MKQILSLILMMALAACHDQPSPSRYGDSTVAKKDSLKTEAFYPLTQYIQDQISYVDSTPFAIEKHTYINGKRVDSVLIDRQEFNKLAAEFLKPDLNDSKIKQLYIESSYQDLTINSVTFDYTTQDHSQELQQADVLLNPETKKVKNIIFRKNRLVGDTSVSINGLWKNNMNFQLNYTFQPAKGKTQTKQIKVIWDRPMVSDY
ncbi:MAG: hypothetical protein ABIX01_19470 [Chitinophagaceae bacterium]